MLKKLVQTSKFLSLVLRHKPEIIGLCLDSEGWVEIEKLLNAAKEGGKHISRETLNEVVLSNDKQRFALSPDGFKSAQIRVTPEAEFPPRSFPRPWPFIGGSLPPPTPPTRWLVYQDDEETAGWEIIERGEIPTVYVPCRAELMRGASAPKS